MRDLIYLSVGDTTVPFADYEGDTAAYCRGVHDAFRYLGIDSEVSEAICHAVEEKPTNVQKVFLLRVLGLRTGRIAELTHIPGRTVRRYAHDRIEDVRGILRSYVRPVPAEPYELADTVWPN